MNYLQATELFLKRKARYLAIKKGAVSKDTMQTYKYNIEILGRYILKAQHGHDKMPLSSLNIEEITSDDIEDYLLACIEAKNSAPTINIRLNTYKSMWNELNKSEGLTNITKDIPSADHIYKRKASVTREHLKTLMNHFESIKHKNKTHFRNHIFFSTMRFYGLRISEALNLQKTKTHLLDDAIKFEILGKGNKTRIRSLPLFNTTGEPIVECQKYYNDVKTYIEDILPEFNITEPKIKDNLFFSQHKSKWNEDSARLAFQVALKKTKLHLHHYTPHSLRHAFVSHKLADGVPLQTVSRLVDHSNVAITSAIYAHSEEQDLIDGMSKGIF